MSKSKRDGKRGGLHGPRRDGKELWGPYGGMATKGGDMREVKRQKRRQIRREAKAEVK